MKTSALPSRRHFLKSASAFAGAPLAAAPGPRPNLLFILAGGWRAPAAADTRLPNLEALAKQGVQFERFYTCNPSPGPARAALLTGRFPFAAGVPRDGDRLPLDQPSIAEQLKRAGYRTGYIGEWRLDGAEEPGSVPPGPRRHGFDYWAAFNRGQGSEPGRQSNLAVDFMKPPGSQPFCLFLAWTPPRGAPNQASYNALCSALDSNVGGVMEALEQHRLSKNTILVFTSDCGAMLGAHELEGDGQPFEEAVRVPLIVRYPGVLPAGQKRDSLVSGVDLMPALLRLCGAEIPPGAQGQDFSIHRESIYSSGKLGQPDQWRMVVRGLDKLVVDRDLNVIHLYNLGQDPSEMENLARDGPQDLKRDELKALLKDWMRRAADGVDSSGLKKR